ncbi:MAG TPA: hypothetical protein VG269_29430 [Tepidisphaeraceae bacterium]|jgi:uncharacterized delta-60 repeat protein|nr:hypothetical protein [Tepidisphaeraceae bacterium]
MAVGSTYRVLRQAAYTEVQRLWGEWRSGREGRSRRPAVRRPGRKATVEALEPRQMLSVTATISGSSTFTESPSGYVLNLSDTATFTKIGWSINWGDNSVTTASSAAASATHVYEDGHYTINATFSDTEGDGTHTATSSLTLTVNEASGNPSLTLCAAGGVAEGSAYTIFPSFSEPGGEKASYAVWWGDTNGSTTYTGGQTALVHTFLEPGSYGVTVMGYDSDYTGGSAGCSSACVTANISEAVPNLSAWGPSSVTEGSLYSLAANFGDPGSDAVSTYVAWWDNNNSGSATSGGLSALTHSFLEPGNYCVTLVAFDEDHSTGLSTWAAPSGYSASVVVNVCEAAATLLASGGGVASITEGSTYTLYPLFNDPGQDPLTTVYVNWGDGSASTYPGTLAGIPHNYAAEPGQYNVTFKAYDEDYAYDPNLGPKGANASSTSVALTVNEAAQTPWASVPASIVSGITYNYTVGINDPGGDLATYTIDWGDETTSSTDVAGASAVFPHSYPSNSTYNFTFTAVDEDGAVVGHGTAVVSDVPTAIVYGDNGGASVAEGSSYKLHATFNDLAGHSASSWVINWGDGGPLDTENTEAGPFYHTFAEASNSYIIQASAYDTDGVTTLSVDATIAEATATAAVWGASTAFESATPNYVLNFGFTDPGDDASGFWVNWGDGTPSAWYGGAPSTAAHGFSEPGTYQPRFTAIDEDHSTLAANGDDGNYSALTTVTISETVAFAGILGASSSVEGSLYQFAAVFHDDGGDPVTQWQIDWGDPLGTVESHDPVCNVYGHDYMMPGDYTVTATAVYEDGTTSVTQTIHVNPLAPVLQIQGATSVVEGSDYDLDLWGAYPPADGVVEDGASLTWHVDWGDGNGSPNVEMFGGAVAAQDETHVYTQAGPYAVTATAVDDHGVTWGPVVLNGQLDVMFGSGPTPGIVTTDFNGRNDQGRSVALQPAGAGAFNIIAAGISYNSDGTTSLALARYSPLGRLDTNFGPADSGGKVLTAFGGADAGSAIAVQSDGSIFVAGQTAAGQFAITRFSADGIADGSFGGTGIATTHFGWAGGGATAMALQSVGGTTYIVVAGTVNGNFALARYTTQGFLDATTSGHTGFGDGSGEIIVDLGGWEMVHGLAIDPSGNIVVSGESANRFALARFNPSGTLTWEAVTPLAAGSALSGAAVAIQSDGKIVLAGTDYSADSIDFVVARYTPAGALDSTFGAGGPTPGMVTTGFAMGAWANAIALESDALGQTTGIIVAGQSAGQIALARYLVTNGRPDPAFGVNGTLLTTAGADSSAAALLVQPDGKILLAGTAQGNFLLVASSDLALARYEQNNTLDVQLAAPDQITLVASVSTIQLSWVNHSPDATGVEVDRSVDGVTYAPVASLSADMTSYRDSGLAVGTQYYYKIAAIQAGASPAYSDPASAYTAGASNTSIHLTATSAAGAEIDLAWTAGMAGTAGIEIDRSTDGTNFNPVQSLPGDATAYSDTGLAPGGHYWYEIRYLHADGTWQLASPANGWVTPPTPTNLVATPRGSHQVDLSWTASDNPNASDPNTAYDIYRTGPDGTIQVGTTLGVQFSDATVQPGFTYSYQIAAQVGNSGQSSRSASTEVGQLAAAPSLTAASAVSPAEVDLTWTDGSPNIDGFEVQRTVNDATGSSFSVIAILNPPASAFADTTVTDGNQYAYRIRALQGGNESDTSNSLSAITPLVAPSGFTATAPVGDSSEVDLSWTFNSTAPTNGTVTIDRSSNSPGNFVPLPAGSNDSGTYVDRNVTPGVHYYYRLRVTNSVSTSSYVLSDVTPPPTVPDTYPTVSKINLVIDSNNQYDNQYGFPDPTIGDTVAREAIKNDPSLPGANLWIDSGFSGVPNYSVNGDGTRFPLRPAWSYGYGLNSADTTSPTLGSGGTTIAIELPFNANWNWDTASLTIAYAASDPAAVTFTGAGTLADPYVYTLPSGDTPLRLWSTSPSSIGYLDGKSSQPFLTAFQGGAFDAYTSYYVAPGTYSGQALKALFHGYGALTTTLGVEGVQPTHNTTDRTISVSLNPGDGTPQQSDQGLVTVGTIDLAIDSDNTSPPGNSEGANPDLPSRSISQQQINSDITKPGKVLVVNDADTNDNGIPRFADGYTTDSISANANPAEHFVPIVLQIPDAVDVSQMLINFDYDASDPRFVQRPTAAEPNIGYAPAPGSLRIWTAPGDTLRDGRPVEEGGQFVSADRIYQATGLGFTNSQRAVTLYVEAVAGGAGAIYVGLNYADSPSYAPFAGIAEDYVLPDDASVRYTAVHDTAMAYGDPANTLVGDASGSDGGDAASASFSGAVNLADGTVATPAVTDLASEGFGQPWGVTRVWTNSAVSQLSPGVVGNGWVVSEMPSLIQGTSTIIANIDGRNGSEYFDSIPGTSGSPPSFKARLYSQDSLAYDEPNDAYVLTDTTGGKLTFYGFGTDLPANRRGRLKLMTDAAGNATMPYYNSLGQLDTVIRSDGTVTETWTYVYYTRDPKTPDAPDRLMTVALSRSGGSAPGLVRTVRYTYYPAADPNQHGNKGDLKTVEVDDAAGAVLSTYYYRYVFHPPTAFAPRLGNITVILDPVGYARYMAQPGASVATLDAATDDALRPYADTMLAYWTDPGPVFSQSIMGTGASNTSGNTAATYQYDYATSADPAVGTNVWTHSTTELRATSSVYLINKSFTNYAGEVMAASQTPNGSSQSWNSFAAYDPEGRMILQALPSAVINLDPTMPDLVGKEVSGGYALLKAYSGLIMQTEYGSSTAGGTVDGYVSETAELHGTQGLTDATADADGTRVPVSTTLYQTRSAGQATDYLVSSRTLYGADNYGDPRTTGYSYLAWNALQPAEVQTLAPTTSEDSTGSSQTTIWFDIYGRVRWTQDALGYINFTAYDNGTGAVTTSVVDVSLSSSPPGAAAPDDLSRPSVLPQPLALKTTISVDSLGRPLYVDDPRSNRTFYSYVDTKNSSEVDTLPPAGPLQVAYVNYAQGFADSLTYSGAQLSTASTPHGGTIQSLTRETLDNAGRVIYSDRYFDLAGVGYSTSSAVGAKDTNYYRTAYVYDFAGRLSSVADDLGTVTQSLYDALGRVTATLLGGTVVNAGGTISTVGGTTIATDVYDGGAVGDGNLTQVTQIPGPDSLNKVLPNHVTTNYYDWRDRVVASDNSVRLTYNILDNVGEVTEQSVYDRSTAGFPAFAAPDGFINGNPVLPTTSSALRARTATLYDDRGRAYRSTQLGVDPSTGAAPSVGVASVSSGTFYDAAGQVIATSSPTGLWTKTTFDGAGRVDGTYSTDNAGGDPTGVSQDHVFSQQAITHDADSDPTLTVTSDRLPTDGSATGALGGAGGPAARVASVQNVYDTADRPTETDNFGTNAVTSDASGALVTKQVYDLAGQVGDTIDAAGVWTQYLRDYLGRVTSRWDDYNSGAAANSAPDVNKVTAYTYNGADEVKSVSVINFIPAVGGAPSRSEVQKTTYDYGTTNSLDKSELSVVHYPDTTTQAYVYDHLGETVQKTDQDHTQHHYSFDPLGRRTLDYVDHIAAGVDSTVTALATVYDVLDRPVSMNSDSGVPGAFALVNQVANVYGAFGNVSKQYQQGSINAASTLVVQYGYDPVNPTRLQRIVYPDGRVEWYTYSGLDAAIGRVSSVNDGSVSAAGQSIEQYSYLGLETVVGKTRPQSGTSESIGLDAYGRAGSVQWSQGSTVTDSFNYTFDNMGRMLSAANVAAAAAGHPELGESYTYDKLGRQVTFKRGMLAGNVADASQVNSTWQVDSSGNRYGGRYGTAYTLNIPAQFAVLPGGETTQIKLFDGGQRTLGATYDAWGRLVSSSGTDPAAQSGPIRLTVYVYDALGRRIESRSYPAGSNGATGTPTSDTRSYYSGQDVIEERDATTGNVTSQYVWSAAGDGALVLRDRDTDNNSATSDSRIPSVTGVGLDERLYAQTDGSGSVTSITEIGGTPVERYQYDQDGRPTALRPDWTPWPVTDSGTQNAVTSRFDWQFLYKGMRWQWIISNNANSGLQNQPPWGLYDAGGGSWYDPNSGRRLQPDYTAYAMGVTPYDPHKEAYTVPWWEYALPYSPLTTTSWFMDAADVARPVLKGAALVGSFIPPIAGPSIAVSIFLNGADTYAAGASWGQLGKQVGIEAGVTLATFGLFKGVGMLTARSAALSESRMLSESAQGAFAVEGAAQGPALAWAKNVDGARSLEEAVRIARANGVEIPDDVSFHLDEDGLLPPNTSAQYYYAGNQWVGKPVRWTDFYSKFTGKIPVQILPSVLESDEAIVAVFTHEFYELNSLRRIFSANNGVLRAEVLHDLINPGIPRNLHDEAWNLADQAVLRMRGN